MRLKGKVALITGATSGIGRATAILFAGEGAKVVVCGRNRKRGEEVVERIKRDGGEAEFVQADVSRSAVVRRMVATAVEKYGKIDILVNNAGIAEAGKPCVELEEEEWDRTISVNLKGVFLCSKAVLPTMIKQRGGKIVNMSSISGPVIGGFNEADYEASKSGVVGFTRALAVEVGKYGINVNAIAPGIIETPMTVKGKSHLEQMKKFAERWIPLRRIGKPEDVANLILFLSSDDSSYITGQVIVIDGGKTMRLPRSRGEIDV